MKITNIDEFLSEMEERGYRRGQSFHYQHKPEHSLWKSFYRGEENGYQICVGVWDNRHRHEHGGIGVSFDMKMNHQTGVQVDRLDLHMMDEGMDVAEFERRCEALWEAMLVVMPRKVKTTY